MRSVTLKQPTERLEVRLAENQLEIEECLALRYEIFNRELGEGLPESAASCKDRDAYDLYCDHLVVLDQSRPSISGSATIVGTYRILRGTVARSAIGFYSETEFDLAPIYRLDGEVAEIGRSCVHPDYRDGEAISLLWAGLAQYIKEYNIRYLIGCGSLHTTDVDAANGAYAWLREGGHLADSALSIAPLPSHRLPGFDPNHQPEDLRRTRSAIPSLLLGYLRAGSKIGGEPALDATFGTIDFFIFFDSTKISERFRHLL